MNEIKKVLLAMSIGVPFIMFFIFSMVLMGESTASTHESVTIVAVDGFAVPFSKDVYYSITSQYGYREDPVYGGGAFHSGLDLAPAEGTPVLATADGVVVETGGGGALGNYVYIKHETKDNGIIYSAYGHMQDYSISVSKNKNVKQGQIIGRVGSTGKSTGPHLHFMIMKTQGCFVPECTIDPKYIVKGIK